MIYVVVCVIEVLCVAVTLAPLREGAACTPATHRARQVFGGVCGALAVFAWARFLWFVVVNGHAIGANVVVGQLVGLSLAVQAVVLLRGTALGRRSAVSLAVGCGALAIAAAVKAALTFA